MEKITAVIVDDEPEARDIMANLLANLSDIEVVDRADSAEKAIFSIQNHHPELLFLDIDMPRKNGFELLKELKESNQDLTVIFVTAYNQYAIEAIKHAAFDYLVKPVDANDLKETIERYKADRTPMATLGRIENLLQALQEEKFQFNTRTGYIYINPSEIIYCRAEGNYTDLYLQKDEKETVTMNIGRIENHLPPKKFMKVNRSTIINKQYLSQINRKDKKCVLIANDKIYTFPISTRYFKSLEKN